MKNIILEKENIKTGEIVELTFDDSKFLSKVVLRKEDSILFKGIMARRDEGWESDDTDFEFSNSFIEKNVTIKKIQKAKKQLKDINMDRIVKNTTVRFKKEFYNYLGLENGLYKFKRTMKYPEQIFFNEEMLLEDNISIVVL